MNMLDSPLEALAFNYVSFSFFPVVNNLWPWVAIITAAVSVWRIRAASIATIPSSKANSEGCQSQPESSPPAKATELSIPAPRGVPAWTDVSGVAVLNAEAKEKLTSDDGSGRRKVRKEIFSGMSSPENAFLKEVEHGVLRLLELSAPCPGGILGAPSITLRYEEVCNRKREGVIMMTGEWCGDSCGEWWRSWETLLRMRMGKDWYRYQDLKIFNGNVVRLWDEHGLRYM